MKIKDVKTTLLHIPHIRGYQDATVRHPQQGRTTCFVHIITDDGLEGLGPGSGGHALRELVERNLKEILIGQNPLHIEKIWDDFSGAFGE